MSVEKLLKLIPPPQHPAELGGPEAWQSIEDWLGMRFPADYRELCSRYGTGAFCLDVDPGVHSCDFVLNPCSPAYREAIARLLNNLRDRVAEVVQDNEFPEHVHYPDPFPWPVFPDRGGALPVAVRGETETLYYLTDPSSDRWDLLIEDHQAEGAPYGFIRRSVSLAEELFGTYALLRRKVGRVRFESRALSTLASWRLPNKG